MSKILAFLSGRKTYIVSALVVIGGLAVKYGLDIPSWVWLVLGGAGLASVRAGVDKVKEALNEAEVEE